MNMKGQAWAEYIIVLAVVIIIAGIAMYLAGSFLGGSSRVEEQESASYWLSTDVAIIRYYVNSSQSQLVIKNNKNFKINVINITSRGVGILVAPGGTSSITLEPGQTAQVNVTDLTCSGGTYSLPLVITYSDASYKTKYSLYGEKPLAGQCMGSAPMPVAPECTKNSDCGTNSTPCNQFCNVTQRCIYLFNPATCQRTCSSGKCADCTPSCGTANCTSCGVNTTSCPPAYCLGNQSCTYPPTASCTIPCSGSTCTTCTPTCAATCANCSASQKCQNGSCVNICNNNSVCETGENYTNCPYDCCNSDCTASDGKCHAECAPYCTGWVGSICNNQNKGYKACASGTQNVTCCNAISTCPGGQVCQNGNCVDVCNNNGVCEIGAGETYSNCPHDCCEADCTAAYDTTCHQECSPYCNNFRPACGGALVGDAVCVSSTQYTTCCNGVITICPSPTTKCCPGGFCVRPTQACPV